MTNDATRDDMVDADEAEQMGEIIKATLKTLVLKIPERAATIIVGLSTEAEIVDALHTIIWEVLAEAAATPVRPRRAPAHRPTPATPGETTIEELSKQTGIAVPVLIQAASVVLHLDVEDIDAFTIVSTGRTPARFDSESEGIRKLGEIAAAAYNGLSPRSALM